MLFCYDFERDYSLKTSCFSFTLCNQKCCVAGGEKCDFFLRTLALLSFQVYFRNSSTFVASFKVDKYNFFPISINKSKEEEISTKCNYIYSNNKKGSLFTFFKSINVIHKNPLKLTNKCIYRIHQQRPKNEQQHKKRIQNTSRLVIIHFE